MQTTVKFSSSGIAVKSDDPSPFSQMSLCSPGARSLGRSRVDYSSTAAAGIKVRAKKSYSSLYPVKCDLSVLKTHL